MAGFETSNVAAQVAVPNGQQQNGPVETLGKIANIQNSLNQNRFFQARAIAGQYLTQATGPNGEPDFNKFTSALQQDPRTAPFAPEILQSAAALKGAGIQNETNQRALRQAQYDSGRNIIATYGNDPKLKTKENYTNASVALSKAVQAGLLPADVAGELISNPENFEIARTADVMGGYGGSGAQVALTGQPTQIATHQGTTTAAVNPYAGTVTGMSGDKSYIPNELSDADLAQQISVVDQSTGSKHLDTYGQYFDRSGHLLPGKQAPVMDLGPLSATARAAYGQALGPDINTFEKFAADAPQEKTYLKLMDNSVGGPNGFHSGPNSDFWRQAGELASEYGIKFNSGDVADPVKASETFRKIMPSLLRAQAARLGMSETDTSRLIAQTSLPDGNLTEDGIHRIIGMSQGLADAQIAQAKVWQQEKAQNGPESFGNFRMDWSRKMPPSVFMAQYMKPAEITDMQKGWSATQKADWQKRYNIAKSQGWLPGDTH